MYNSQYYSCEQIDQRLLQGYLDDYNTQNNTNLTKAEFLTLLFNTVGRNNTIDNLVTQIGYYECDTAAGTAAKAITVANYNLFAGGSIKVKFVNKNTANNVTLNINNQGAKALYYQGEVASSTNSWDEGEVVEIYYDGTSYYANNVKGGSGSGVYDVSVEHPNSGPNSDGKFTLEYILNPSNVNELIPVNKRYPGMSIQFVSSSDNKYVQFRYMGTSTANADFTNVKQWQGVDVLPVARSKNLIESDAVYNIEAALDKNSNFLEFELGNIDGYGQNIDSDSRCRMVGFLPCSAQVDQRAYRPDGTQIGTAIRYYDENKVFTSSSYTSSARYFRILYLSNVLENIKITITINSQTGIYTTSKYKHTANISDIEDVNTSINTLRTETNTKINSLVLGQNYKAKDFEYLTKYYYTSTAVVGRVINLVPTRTFTSQNTASTALKVKNGEIVVLHNWKTLGDFGNALCVDKNGKILEIYNISTNGNHTLNIHNDGYLLVSGVYTDETTYIEGAHIVYDTNKIESSSRSLDEILSECGKNANVIVLERGNISSAGIDESNDNRARSVGFLFNHDRITINSATAYDLTNGAVYTGKINNYDMYFAPSNTPSVYFRLTFYKYSEGAWVTIPLHNLRIEVDFNGTVKEYYTEEIKPIKFSSVTFESCYLAEMVAKAKSGQIVKFAFWGDSTTDGVGTTGWTDATGHESQDMDAGGWGKVDYINQHAYPYLLERLLKEETGNNNIRCYNIGYSGKNAQFANDNKKAIFSDVYADANCVGISYGINDTSMLDGTDKMLQTYKRNMSDLIEFLINTGRTPFLIHPQSICWKQERMIWVVDIMNELAKRYNLQVLDMSEYDRNVMKYSSLEGQNITDGAVHWNDNGHKFEAGFLFSEIIKRTAKCSKTDSITYTDQYSSLPLDQMSMLQFGKIDSVFKAYMSASADGNDSILMGVWILNDSKSAKNIISVCQNVGTQYCVITDIDNNTQNVTITSAEQTVKTLNVGEIVHIVVHCGTGIKDFVGFKLT